MNSAALYVKTLHDLWYDHKKSEESRLYFVHAILLLVRAPKSRTVDNATVAFFRGVREKREIPDYALDKHTSRGRAMGRGFGHFFAHGAMLEPQPPEDAYEKRAIKALIENVETTVCSD